MGSLVTSIFAVFTEIAEWLPTAFTAILPMFYVAETGLTLLGTLCVLGLGMSIIFLVLGIIISFFKWRA